MISASIRISFFRYIFTIILFAFVFSSTGPAANEGCTYIYKVFLVLLLISQWSQHPERAIKTRQSSPIFSCYVLQIFASRHPPSERHRPPHR